MSSNPLLVGHAHTRDIEVIDDKTLRFTGVDNQSTAAERTNALLWEKVMHPRPAVNHPRNSA